MRAIDADALKEDLTRFYDNEVTARKLIDEQPTIQLEPHWIPVTERTPRKRDHKDDMVLVCNENGSIRFNTCINGTWVYGDPIAWMPLPEPYKGVTDGRD